MRRSYKIIISSVLISGAVLFFVATALLFVNWKTLFVSEDRQIDAGPLRKTTTTSCTTRPISLEEAEKTFTFPFPRSASNIQFACYKEFLACTILVRFEAPSADCIAAVPAALDYQGFAEINKLSDEARVLRPVSKMFFDKTQDTGPLVVPWFNPDQIGVGLETGFAGSYEQKVWIDTERGIFYYRLCD